MRLKVEFLSYLARFIGSRKVEVDLREPVTVRALVNKLIELYGDKFTQNFLKNNREFKENIVLLINGLSLPQASKELHDPYLLELKESDDITFIVPFGGG
ncbi:MAG: MoaD/ThiS family protein [Promethearchaeota archaeon]